MSESNFALARWARNTGHKLRGTRENDHAEYILSSINRRDTELSFEVRRDNQYYRTLLLRTSGTLEERKLQLPHVAMDKEWFSELTLEPVLPDTITQTFAYADELPDTTQHPLSNSDADYRDRD